MTSGSAGFLPAKTPTVACFELFAGSPRSALVHRDSQALLDISVLPSVCMAAMEPHPAASVSVGSVLLSARALTRAFLSLGPLFGRRLLRSSIYYLHGLFLRAIFTGAPAGRWQVTCFSRYGFLAVLLLLAAACGSVTVLGFV